ncbi:hypothetical protein NOZE110980_12625 [Nocardioides zeicaulis]
MHVTPAEVLGRDDLAGRGLHQRRAAEEDRALVAHDHRLVGHRRHVGAARGARAHHAGDLRDAAGRHVRLVEEDPPEVLAVGEDLVLHRQERTAGVDEVEARQAVLRGDRLGTQVLLDRHRVVGAALDRRVVGDDHALAARHPADAADDAGGRDGVVVAVAAVHAVGGEGSELQERAAGVEQAVDAVADEELAAVGVLAPRALRAALADPGEPVTQVVDELAHGRGGLGLGHHLRLAIVNPERPVAGTPPPAGCPARVRCAGAAGRRPPRCAPPCRRARRGSPTPGRTRARSRTR